MLNVRANSWHFIDPYVLIILVYSKLNWPTTFLLFMSLLGIAES